MATNPIYAEQTVSITDLRKSPATYFINEPVAVLSNNRTAGYIVPAEVYQHMVNMIEQAYPEGRSRFRPSRARLDVMNWLPMLRLLIWRVFPSDKNI
jgi:antitoxin YafN